MKLEFGMNSLGSKFRSSNKFFTSPKHAQTGSGPHPAPYCVLYYCHRVATKMQLTNTYISVCLSVYLCVCPSIYQSIYLSIYSGGTVVLSRW